MSIDINTIFIKVFDAKWYNDYPLKMWLISFSVDDGRDEGVELLKTGGHCLEAEPAFSQYPITVVTLIIAKATVLVLLLEHLFNILSGGSHKLVKYSQVSLREKVVTTYFYSTKYSTNN